MDPLLASTWQTAVFDRLDYLDRLSTKADPSSQAALAETEITRMTAAWRSLLAEHQPDDDGRCPKCSQRRRHVSFPCSVWSTAHHHLLGGAA